MLQLAVKALVSGALIAAASEIARRSPAWGGLVASLPLVSLLTMLWLWRDTGDPLRVADLAVASSVYVVASLPAFLVLAWLLRGGTSFAAALALFVAVGALGFLVAGVAGRRWGIAL